MIKMRIKKGYLGLGPKAIFKSNTPCTTWTRYVDYDFKEVNSPTYKYISQYDGSYPGWYRATGSATSGDTVKVKKSQTKMAVKGLKKTIKYKTLKKKNKVVTALKVSGIYGPKKFKKISGKAKITVNSKTGKFTIKKGLKKGKYKVRVKVMALGNDSYKSASKTVTATITVK